MLQTSLKEVESDSNSNEKGLRSSGDNESHNHDGRPRTLSWFMSLASMVLLFTGSQIPIFLLGPALSYICNDIGGGDRAAWYILGNLIALAAVCPFVGSLSDLLGRRWVALLGAGLLVIGMIIVSTATSMNTFIAGMVLSGAAAGINELTAIAVTTEMAPTAKRGKYVAILILSLIPYIPGVFWSQLVASHSIHAWRYLGLWCGIWAFFGLGLTFIFFHPAPRVNSIGLNRSQVLQQIDWVGGLLSVAGTILFIMGLLWSGYQYPWDSLHVIVTLILGALMLVGFVIWEKYWAKYPMFPKRLQEAPRTMGLIMLITFMSGANFFAVLVFWPTQSTNVYGHDPISNGWRSLPVGLSVSTGAFIVLILLSLFRGQARLLLVCATSFMTIGTASMAFLDRDNMKAAYGILAVAGMGIGGLIVPASVMTTIICPDDLIATISALTLSIRVIGGAIGYSTFFNVLQSKFVPSLQAGLTGACIEAEVFDPKVVGEIAVLLATSLNEHILPLVGGNQTKADIFILAGQVAFAGAYKWVYYVSVPFGLIALVAACFIQDISPYMDNHIAVAY